MPAVNYPNQFRTRPVYTVQGGLQANVRWFQRQRSGFRQKMPSTRPRPYQLLLLEGTFGTQMRNNPNGTRYDVVSCEGMPLFVRDDQTVAGYRTVLLNRAYDRFLNKVRPSAAELGITVAQVGKSYDMVAARASQLYRGYRNLRSGNFDGFLREFGLRRRPGQSPWSRPRDASKLWLEYWFGWTPLIRDIQDAMDVLDSPGREGSVSGQRSFRLTRTWTQPIVQPSTRLHKRGEVRITARVGGRVRIVNHDAFLRSRLGVANALVVAWDLVPFSFVVDWFTGVNRWLSARTDLQGCEVLDGYYTLFERSNNTFWRGGTGGQWSGSGREIWLRRYDSFYKPVPEVPAFFLRPGLSKTRAATAISLLVSIFTR